MGSCIKLFEDAFNRNNPFVCTTDPQKVKGIIENLGLKALNFMIFVKNSRGGREVNMINTLSKINLSKIG